MLKKLITICLIVLLKGCASQTRNPITAEQRYKQVLEMFYADPLRHQRLDMLVIIHQEEQKNITANALSAFSGPADIFDK